MQHRITYFLFIGCLLRCASAGMDQKLSQRGKGLPTASSSNPTPSWINLIEKQRRMARLDLSIENLNSPRAKNEISVGRISGNSMGFEPEGLQRRTAMMDEELVKQQTITLEPKDAAIHGIDVLKSTSNNFEGNGDMVIWFLLACIMAQVLTMLSMFGVWCPKRFFGRLGYLCEAISSDTSRLVFVVTQTTLVYVSRVGHMVLRLKPLSGIPSIPLITRIIHRKQINIQYPFFENQPSRFPPFLVPGTSAERVKYLYLPEQQSPSSSFSSLSSYSSDLPFLRRPEPDQSIYNPIHFDFIRNLGEGHFGKVVQLQHRGNGQMVAAKIMAKRKSEAGAYHRDESHTTLSSMLEGGAASFDSTCGGVELGVVYGEIRAMLRVQNSPYADWSPRVLSTFVNEDSYFIVMPFYERGDIIDCMKRGGGCISRGLAKFYISELISAIHFLHTLRIIHRDIKPDNLLIGIDGHLVVADLGVAYVFKESSSFENSFDSYCNSPISAFGLPSSDSAVWLDDEDYAMWEEGKRMGGDDFPFLNPSTDNPHVITGEHGTPMYAAPEVFSGGKYSYGVDYYSMGMVYHQMITGYLPLADGGPAEGNRKGEERRWLLDLGRHDLHLQVLSAKERCFLEKVLQQDPFERPSVSKMKADPLFADINWDKIGRREEIVPPALCIRKRGSLQLATARCESDNMRFDSRCVWEQYDCENHLEKLTV
ncbi:hypothetical protein CVT24_004195 [Panaeolus cyanescens]|uniref:non-specific serine/threonine protein kinase n=1 Tax=Panaeolus cyanescens TaxID=181874 RepID=A0A409W7W7_9AGAR|nr:hypothetical protein CVT24_004195 [Panaeolus cyanescens]